MGFMAAATLARVMLLVCTAAAVMGYSDDVNPLTGRSYNKIIIGGLATSGEANLYSRWNATFFEYLTTHVDPAFNLTFEFVSLDFETNFEMVESRNIDLVFTNPSLFTCLEAEYGAAAAASLLFQRTVAGKEIQVTKFYGSFIVRTNSSIMKISEIVDKTVQAVSLLGLGSGQLQWDELIRRGLDLFALTRQVRFSGSQKNVIADVISGAVDIGFIRTGMYEGFVESGEFPANAVRVLEDRNADLPSDSQDRFFLPYSTTLGSPEWCLATLPWMDPLIGREVSATLFSITPDSAAALAGQYSTWISPLTYHEIHDIHHILGWKKRGLCTSEANLCQTITCPSGTVRKSCAQIASGCADLGLECPSTYDCICKPCQNIPENELNITLVHYPSGQAVNPSAVTESAPCQKMMECAVVEQSDVIEVKITDNWVSVRDALGVAAPTAVLFQMGSQGWKLAEKNPNEAGVFKGIFAAGDEGQQHIRARICFSQDDPCLEIADSPLFIDVRAKTCLQENTVPNGDGVCFCLPVFKEGLNKLGETTCEKIGSDDGDHGKLLLIIISATVIVALMTLVAMVALLKCSIHHRRHTDVTWHIKLSELKFSDPPMILGRGTFGQVLMADFRGTEVAVKRVLPRAERSSSKPGSTKHTETTVDDSDLLDKGKLSALFDKKDSYLNLVVLPEVAYSISGQRISSYGPENNTLPGPTESSDADAQGGKFIAPGEEDGDQVPEFPLQHTGSLPLAEFENLLTVGRLRRSITLISKRALPEHNVPTGTSSSLFSSGETRELYGVYRSRASELEMRLGDLTSVDETDRSTRAAGRMSRGSNAYLKYAMTQSAPSSEGERRPDPTETGDGEEREGSRRGVRITRTSSTSLYKSMTQSAPSSELELEMGDPEEVGGSRRSARTTRISLSSLYKSTTQSTQSSEKGEGEKRPGTETETDDPEEVGGSRRCDRTKRTSLTSFRRTYSVTQSAESSEGMKRPDLTEICDLTEVGGNRRSIRTARNLLTGFYTANEAEMMHRSCNISGVGTSIETGGRTPRHSYSETWGRLAAPSSVLKGWFKPQKQVDEGSYMSEEGMRRSLDGGGSVGERVLSVEQHRNLKIDFITEMQVMVYLRHPNIVTVMGAVLGSAENDDTQEPLMVMEHMKHGSLYDLLHNDTMQFDGGIIMDILTGIVSGMTYLHTTLPPVLHNDLKTANVLIGSNFMSKLADFGLSMKKKSNGYLGTPFWMAPELLDLGTAPSVKSDVYSFAITLFELFVRKEPFQEHEDPVYVIETLANSDTSYGLMRPTLPADLPPEVVSLITLCWAQDPDERPTFEEIRIIINAFKKDMLDKWFEKDGTRSSTYARVKRLASRPEAADEDTPCKLKKLLYEVFPEHIANQLKEGKKVEPEQHECVTIFFSDIVGFTDISRQLQPVQVMTLLDRLYEKFDALARKHGVFKVETIGDAYMAVANLVAQQPDHTQLIAAFSIDVIKAANETLILENQPGYGCVNVRVGFHSGPVVSSVVGSLNPRFCLFGDTVNTSSRMESHSERNRIHISEAAAHHLMVQAPSVKLVCRGLIEIKGKGKMKTYWLPVNQDLRSVHIVKSANDRIEEGKL